MVADQIRFHVERDRVRTAIFLIVILALLARLVTLGYRVAHFDEARVAWWSLNHMRTGQFQYRYIIHGPFLQHINSVVFSLLGPTDFALRFVPALVGGLLPLSALLFRAHLRSSEVVALALFLAFNPVLLYYSRFSRNTILVASFMFVAFGLFVRAINLRDARYAYAAVAFAGLGFTAKENAIVYLIVWVGATVLLVDHRLFSPLSDESGLDRLRAIWPSKEAYRRVGPLLKHIVIALFVFIGVVVFFYAPRGVEIGLFRVVTNPVRLPAMVEATIGLHPQQFDSVNWQGGYDGGIIGGLEYWFGGPSRSGQDSNVVTGYVETLGRFLRLLAEYAAPLLGLGLVGFLAERYASARPRELVMFSAYWGFVSVLGYPFGTDIWGAWITVNALIPLAIPAAVGLALVYRWGREALADQDRAGTALAVFLVVLMAGQAAYVGVHGVYLHPTGTDNQLVQYAQPHQDLRPVLQDLSAAAATNDGPDVLIYDDPDALRSLVDGKEQELWTPACLHWFRSLPLPWYIERDRMNATCAASLDELDRQAAADPPFVIARVDNRTEVANHLTDYEIYGTYYHRTTEFEKVVFVHEDYVTS